jgi:hypothetical protein
VDPKIGDERNPFIGWDSQGKWLYERDPPPDGEVVADKARHRRQDANDEQHDHQRAEKL